MNGDIGIGNATNWSGTTIGGYWCNCGVWVAFGTFHTCTVHPQAGYTCGGCGQYVHGWHTCTGSGMWPPAQPGLLPLLPPLPEPAARPESPLAALVTDVCDLLGKAADWLAERRL